MPFLSLSSKPKHKSGQVSENDAEVVATTTPKRGIFNIGNRTVNVEEESWPNIILRWIKLTIAFGILLAILIGGMYAGLATTIMYITKVPVGANHVKQTVVVVRGTKNLTGGIAKPNIVVYGSAVDSAPDQILSRFQEGVSLFNYTIAPVLAQTVAGPNINVAVTPSTTVPNTYNITYKVNDSPTTMQLNNISINVPEGLANDSHYQKLTSGSQYYANTYIAKCLGGTGCVTGSYFLLPGKNISGEVKSLKDLESVLQR